MIVYVETNFVLELALRQEDHLDCGRIIALSREGSLSLVVPAFSLAESFEALRRDHDRRAELRRRLESEFRALSRSLSYRSRADAIAEVTSLLAESQQQEMTRLNATLKELIAVAKVVTLKSTILKASLTLQRTYDLRPQDAIVYASVRAYLTSARQGTKCFLTKDNKDFDNPDLRKDLKAFDCELRTSFADGLRFITRQLADGPK